MKRLDERVRSSQESLSAATKSVPRWIQILGIGAAILLTAIQLIRHSAVPGEPGALEDYRLGTHPGHAGCTGLRSLRPRYRSRHDLTLSAWSGGEPPSRLFL